MSRLKILFLLLINFTLFAKGSEFFINDKGEVSSTQSVNKPVMSFSKVIDMADMLIGDSWTNFSKIKSFAMQNLGGIKSDNDIIIKIDEVSFLSQGRDAKLVINLNSSTGAKGDIRSYYIRVSMTNKEIDEFDKYWKLSEYDFTYNKLRIEPREMSSIGMSDLSGRLRYSSLKSKVPGTDNFIFYPPYLNVIITSDIYSDEERYDVTFAVSKINNSVEIEKVNVEPGNQDFHKNVRRIVEAVKVGKIKSSEFAGDEIKKFYPKDVLRDAHWGSFPEKRFSSKIQLNGTSGSFITGGHYYYGLIRRGDKNNLSSEMNSWVNYLSYALGKNYVAVKKYDQFNLLTGVSFIPVNQDFKIDSKIVDIRLDIEKNIFIEDGQEELVLQISTPLFNFSKYEDFWVPMREMADFN